MMVKTQESHATYASIVDLVIQLEQGPRTIGVISA
jgi:hypothetical protein